MLTNCDGNKDGERIERIINPIVCDVKTEIDKEVQPEDQSRSIIKVASLKRKYGNNIF